MNGCFNRSPYKPEYTIHGISKETGETVSTTIPFRMEMACQYTKTDLGQTDKGCSGCKHKEGATE